MVISNELRRARVPALILGAALCLASTSARAEEPAPSEPAEAPAPSPSPAPADPATGIHHTPVMAAPAREDLALHADVDHPEEVRSLDVVWTSKSGGPWRLTHLERSPGGGYVAIIPAAEVTPAGILYAIELVPVNGKRQPVFASRQDPQTIAVLEDRADTRERALLTRLHGRRSVVTMSGEYVRFGTTTATSPIPCGQGQSSCSPGQLRTPSVSDQFWRVEGGYSYRPLRAVAEFGLRIGVVRGTSLVEEPKLDESKFKVGLNYGEPWVRFRIFDSWHVETSALTSITEVGFSVGGGLTTMIGDVYGTHLSVGAQTIGVTSNTYFGSRFFTRLDLRVREGLTVAPTIEVTDMPHADAYGVRLYGDVLIDLPHGFSLGVRTGYQARKSTSGGVAMGGTAALAF